MSEPAFLYRNFCVEVWLLSDAWVDVLSGAFVMKPRTPATWHVHQDAMKKNITIETQRHNLVESFLDSSFLISKVRTQSKFVISPNPHALKLSWLSCCR